MNRCVSRPYNAGTSSYRPRSSRIARISNDSRAARANVPRSLTTLLKYDKHSGEAHSRDGEIHGADNRHHEELGPGDVEGGRAREDELREAYEMRRRICMASCSQTGMLSRGVAGPDTNCMGRSVRTRSSANCGMDSANVAKAIPIVTVRAGTESLKCQAPDRRSG